MFFRVVEVELFKITISYLLQGILYYTVFKMEKF